MDLLAKTLSRVSPLVPVGSLVLVRVCFFIHLWSSRKAPELSTASAFKNHRHVLEALVDYELCDFALSLLQVTACRSKVLDFLDNAVSTPPLTQTGSSHTSRTSRNQRYRRPLVLVCSQNVNTKSHNGAYFVVFND